jgi:DNA-binding XRE family transcriptional regulator
MGKIITKEVSFLAINLKMLRKINSLTQWDLSVALEIKRSSIGAYEEDRAEPKLGILIRMSDYFGVSLDQLVRVEITNVPPK